MSGGTRIRTVKPGPRRGSVAAPSSKSQAHRLLICAALSERPVKLICRGLSDDIEATARCLSALGAETAVGSRAGFSELHISPVGTKHTDGIRELPCRESGSTLRFLIPVAGALGADADFYMEGRLPRRPLSPMREQLCSHGMSIENKGEGGSILSCRGKLAAGLYELPGNVSSQYISGMLMALPVLEGDSELRITSECESEGYINMTEEVLRSGGAEISRSDGTYTIRGGQRFSYPSEITVEGDWSSAAFFLCMGAFSDTGVTVSGLDLGSCQGDKAVVGILGNFGANVESSGTRVSVKRGDLRGQIIDARMIPDIIPVLSIVAAAADGDTRIINAQRLRLKESDRIRSVVRMIASLGGKAEETEDGLIIHGGGGLCGGTVDSYADHRIAMSAAAAACICSGSVSITQPECTAKSYPAFWEEFDRLEMTY